LFQEKATAFMKFSVFVAPKAVKADLASTTKDDVISELVQSLVDAGEILDKDREDIIKAIMRREELGSTGIGRGVAVPHTKHPSVKKLVGTVGVSPSGLDFESLDGQKACLFFLLVSPPDRPGDHLRALENISRQLRDDQFCKVLSQSKSAHDILQLLEEADSQQSGS
jgi:PTS system fructose-specific IIA component/PTS system nitrogen regulatory IIA component